FRPPEAPCLPRRPLAAHPGTGARHGLVSPERLARMNDMTQPHTLAQALPARAPAKPVVLVPACNRMLGEHPFHIAGKKYLDAVRLAGGQPLVVPSAELNEIDNLLDMADGVLLTGSPSNVHPSQFGEEVLDP